jgi:hypothetical protein
MGGHGVRFARSRRYIADRCIYRLGWDCPICAYWHRILTLKMADETSDLGWQTIVTARHVIDKIPGDQVYIRLNNKRGEAEVISFPKARWWNHPDDRIDVSVCPTKLPKDQFNIVHLFLDKLILDDAAMAQFSVGIGDDVYFPGMFVPRLGEQQNIPILRSGTIAAIAGEKIRTQYGYHQAHLIEARSIDGLSGSPVCLNLPFSRDVDRSFLSAMYGDVLPRALAPHIMLLMGMMLGFNQVLNPGDDIAIIGNRVENSEDPILTPLNTGIAVVLPIKDVIEAIDQPALREERERRLSAVGSRIFVPT